MSDINFQTVLRCEQCNKPFDKQSSLKRHGYYCRSRRVGNLPRSRSCVSCKKRKARCDDKRPACSRCMTKGIECHYPLASAKAAEAKAQTNEHVFSAGAGNTSLSVAYGSSVMDTSSNNASHGPPSLADTLTPVDFGWPNMAGDVLNWEDMDPNFDRFLNSYASESLQQPLPGSPVLRRDHVSPSYLSEKQAGLLLSPIPSIPIAPTHSPRVFVQRPKLKNGTQRTASLILHTLKSYPQMMLRDGTIPPFIHPQLASSTDEGDQMESLTNSMSLVHMISSGIRGSRKLFWRNVGMECERLREELLKMNKRGLLASMQAVCIYILIRLSEGETDDNNYDSLLAGMLPMLIQQYGFLMLNDSRALIHTYGLKSTWKEWIFEESRRRLVVVLRIISMLVYFDPAAICSLPSNLILAPLPAKKQLWEAGDEFAWDAERVKEPGMKDTFGLASDGELVKLDECKVYNKDTVEVRKPLAVSNGTRGQANWEEWCLGMDGFGGLVMLAASLVV